MYLEHGRVVWGHWTPSKPVLLLKCEQGSSKAMGSRALLFEMQLVFLTLLLPLSVKPVQMMVKKRTGTEWRERTSILQFLFLIVPLLMFSPSERFHLYTENNIIAACFLSYWASLLAWGQYLSIWLDCWQLFELWWFRFITAIHI